MKTTYTNLNSTQVKVITDILGQSFNSDQIGGFLEVIDGSKVKGVAVANGAEPFASLTTAAQKVNELLASLRGAGVIAT